jgi:hypothetical protein
MFNNSEIADAMTVKLSEQLPEMPDFVPGIRRAPNRGFHLSKEQTQIANKARRGIQKRVLAIPNTIPASLSFLEIRIPRGIQSNRDTTTALKIKEK